MIGPRDNGFPGPAVALDGPDRSTDDIILPSEESSAAGVED